MPSRVHDTPLPPAEAAEMLRGPVDHAVHEAPWMRHAESWGAILEIMQMATTKAGPPDQLKWWVTALAFEPLSHPLALAGQDRLIAVMCPLSEIRLSPWHSPGFSELALARLQARRTPPIGWDLALPMLWQAESTSAPGMAYCLTAHPMDATELRRAFGLAWRDPAIWTALVQRAQALGWPAPLEQLVPQSMVRILHRRAVPWTLAGLEVCGARLSASALAAKTLDPSLDAAPAHREALMDLWQSLSEAWWSTMPPIVVEQILAGQQTALRLLMITRLSTVPAVTPARVPAAVSTPGGPAR